MDNESQETMDRRPYGYYQTENEVREEVWLKPGRVYTFTIKDVYGDGIVNQGYYQIFAVDGTGESTLVSATKFVGREQSRTFQVPIPFFEAPSMEPTSAPSIQPSILDFGAASNDVSCTEYGQFCANHQDCCSARCHSGLCLASSSSSRLDQRIHPESGGIEP